MKMKIIHCTIFCCLFACATNTGTGALVGGGSGALIGGLAGGWGGAAIGGAAGAILGGLVGNAMDTNQQQQREAAIDNRYPGLSRKLINNEPLTTKDVIHLSQENIPPEQIIHYLQESNSQFSLTQQDCKTLCRKGVDNHVVLYMSKNKCGCYDS